MYQKFYSGRMRSILNWFTEWNIATTTYQCLSEFVTKFNKCQSKTEYEILQGRMDLTCDPK